jgi:hypothetical protein
MPRKRKEPSEQDRLNSTLASFQVNAGQWYDFGSLCEKSGISASQGLAVYINACLNADKLIIESGQPNIESSDKLIIESGQPNIESLTDMKAQIMAEIKSEISSLIRSELGKYQGAA